MNLSPGYYSGSSEMNNLDLACAQIEVKKVASELSALHSYIERMKLNGFLKIDLISKRIAVHEAESAGVLRKLLLKNNEMRSEILRMRSLLPDQQSVLRSTDHGIDQSTPNLLPNAGDLSANSRTFLPARPNQPQGTDPGWLRRAWTQTDSDPLGMATSPPSRTLALPSHAADDTAGGSERERRLAQWLAEARAEARRAAAELAAAREEGSHLRFLLDGMVPRVRLEAARDAVRDLRAELQRLRAAADPSSGEMLGPAKAGSAGKARGRAVEGSRLETAAAAVAAAGPLRPVGPTVPWEERAAARARLRASEAALRAARAELDTASDSAGAAESNSDGGGGWFVQGARMSHSPDGGEASSATAAAAKAVRLGRSRRTSRRGLIGTESEAEAGDLEPKRGHVKLKLACVDPRRREAALEASRAEVERLESELERSRAELERSRAELERSRAELDRSRAELDRSRTELEQSLDDQKMAKAELRRGRSEVLRSASEADSLRDRLAVGEADRAAAEAEAARLRSEVEGLRALLGQAGARRAQEKATEEEAAAAGLAQVARLLGHLEAETASLERAVGCAAAAAAAAAAGGAGRRAGLERRAEAARAEAAAANRRALAAMADADDSARSAAARVEALGEALRVAGARAEMAERAAERAAAERDALRSEAAADRQRSEAEVVRLHAEAEAARAEAAGRRAEAAASERAAAGRWRAAALRAAAEAESCRLELAECANDVVRLGERLMGHGECYGTTRLTTAHAETGPEATGGVSFVTA